MTVAPRSYVDGDLTFFMGLYRDRALAEVSLAQLREHFPRARVIVRSDGDDDPANRSLAARFDLEYREEGRLFPVENGGALLTRAFDLFLDAATPYLFKIDPDTVVHRRFRELPAQDCMFGTTQRSEEGCPSIQGGCIGFTEAAVRSIQDSGLLRDPRLKVPGEHLGASPYFNVMARRADRCGLASFDWILGWAATELSLPLHRFKEVRSRWRGPYSGGIFDLRYAVTHPAPALRSKST